MDFLLPSLSTSHFLFLARKVSPLPRKFAWPYGNELSGFVLVFFIFSFVLPIPSPPLSSRSLLSKGCCHNGPHSSKHFKWRLWTYSYSTWNLFSKIRPCLQGTRKLTPAFRIVWKHVILYDFDTSSARGVAFSHTFRNLSSANCKVLRNRFIIYCHDTWLERYPLPRRLTLPSQLLSVQRRWNSKNLAKWKKRQLEYLVFTRLRIIFVSRLIVIFLFQITKRKLVNLNRQ